MSWSALKAGAPSALVSQLETVKQTLSGTIDTLTTLLQTAKTLIETVLKFVIALDDIQAAAIRALCEAALLIIDDIEKNARQMYALGVLPIDPSEVIGDWGGVQGLIGNNMILSDGSRVLLGGHGGNAGFVRTVAASLEDAYDENRPQFGEDSIVGGAVLITGANTYHQAIALIRKLQDLFSSPLYPKLTIDDQRTPKPRNLQAHTVAPSGLNEYEVKLSWEPESIVSVLDIYGNPRYAIREVVIYRSEWDKTFPRGSLSNYEVARIKYTGFQTSWRDTDFPSEQPRPAWRYYAVGFSLNEISDENNETEIADPLIVKRVSICLGPGGMQPQRNMGIPPDWQAIGLFDLIPPIGAALSTMRQFIEDQKDAAEAASAQMQKLVDELEREIERYTDFVEDVASTIKELVDLLTFPEGYFGFTTLGPFTGGNDAFVQELKEALTNTSDPNRPPFDTGTEIVAGLVLLIGVNKSAGIPAISALLGLMEALFGGVRDEASKLSRDLRAAVQAAEEQICLNDALIQTVCQEIEAPGTILGADLEPALSSAQCEE